MTRPWGTADETARRAELGAALEELEGRLGRACAAAGRARDEVRLLAVTKTFPAADAALLAQLGLDRFAENRDQEAARKVARFVELAPDVAARWHMVGQLQRNKVRSVARWAGEVQSVDSRRLVVALNKAVRAARDAGERTEPMDVLLQVSLDDDPSRGGCLAGDLPLLAADVADSGQLRLRGLMAVAPLEGEPARAFDRLAGIARGLRSEHPDAVELSAGMSGDLEDAVAAGSTCVRVGTALLGGRRLASPQ